MEHSGIGVVSGGSGSSKFVIALNRYSQSKLTFVSNIADNFWHHGVYVCPDVDITTYALSGRLDETKGWGVKGDTHNLLNSFNSLGERDWFTLGDSDFALCLKRTEMMKSGLSLSQVTEYFCKLFKIKQKVIPATDDDVQTHVRTPQGRMHLQEFWVKRHGTPRVLGVEYVGVEKAKPNKLTFNAISKNTIILPANPITSILPTLRLRGVRKVLKHAKVVGVSPFIGDKVISGPAPKLMRAMNVKTNSFGVATMYSDFLKAFLVDKNEEPLLVRKIRDLGIEVVKTNIVVKSEADRKSVANELIRAL
jgi:LPPG:FO 2-phospho-L-lactate transferase